MVVFLQMAPAGVITLEENTVSKDLHLSQASCACSPVVLVSMTEGCWWHRVGGQMPAGCLKVSKSWLSIKKSFTWSTWSAW